MSEHNIMEVLLQLDKDADVLLSRMKWLKSLHDVGYRIVDDNDQPVTADNVVNIIEATK